MPIADIVIGTRHRKDLGDIASLARSIAEVGLLHPIVVRPDGTLIAGERRLAAFKHLERTGIPVTVVDLDKVVRGEYAENFFRKQFMPSEWADITDEMEPIERALAKERMVAAHASPGKFPEQAKGQALDKVARAVGKDRKTVVKARAIRDAAKAEPEKFGKLQADMDRTGRVDGPFKRLKVMTQAAAIRAEPPPYPEQGPYRVIVADVPWAYERDGDPSQRAVLPYATMTPAQAIAEANKVRAIAHEDCVLWFWVTNYYMRDGFDVLAAWGFEPKTILTWVKDKMGRGDWLRGQTEHCLMAVRGNPIVELTNQTTVLHGPVREHSRKPDEFYTFVERLCPAPRYASLFAREARDRWDGHGDEVGMFSEIGTAPSMALPRCAEAAMVAAEDGPPL